MKKRKNQKSQPVITTPQPPAGGFFRGQRRSPDWLSLPRLLTLKQTADLLRVHPNTLRLWDQQGRLSAQRLGSRQDRRYDRQVIYQLWLEHQRTPAENFIRRWSVRRQRLNTFRRRWWRPVSVASAAVALLLVISSSQFVAADTGVPSAITLPARECSGWQQSEQATKVTLSADATLDQFSDKNSAVYDTSFDRVSSNDQGNVAAGSIDALSNTITCSGFSIDRVSPQATLTNPSIEISFASHSQGNTTGGFVLETSFDGKEWAPLYLLSANSEKPGRQTFELDPDLTRETLSLLQVRLRPDISIEAPTVTAWLDGFNLKLTATNPTPTTPQKNSQASRDLNKLVEFSKATYKSGESPVIKVPKQEVEKFLFFTTKSVAWTLRDVTLVDSQEHVIQPKYSTADSEVGPDTISAVSLNTEKLHAGKYTVRVTMSNSDGGQATITKEFLWGVVALNFDRPNPRPNDVVRAEIGVLDDAGVTICNATIEVKLTDPRGQVTTYNAKKKNLEVNPNCVDKGVTNDPDYSFSFTPQRTGIYHIELTAKTDVGERRLEENLLVDAASRFDVQRSEYPTRIYPPAPYNVAIAITPTQDYRGLVTEIVPADFEISDLTPEGSVILPSANSTEKKLEWAVDWRAGETYYLRYTFDAPDISPALFLVGPLSIAPNTLADHDWQESRQWQIASDAVSPNGNMYYGDTTNAGKLKMKPFTSPGTWSGTELNINLGPTVNIMHVVAKTAPTREEKMIGYVSQGGRLDVVTGTTGFDIAGDYTLRWTATAVSVAQDCDAAPTAGTCTQPFDLGYEPLSGRGMVVYAGDSDANSTTDTDVIYYAFWDSSAWSPDTTPNTPSATNQLNLPGTAGTPRWIRVIPAGDNLADQRSNRAIVLVADSNDDLFAFYWDGSTFDSGSTLYSTLGNCASARCFDGNWQGDTNFIVNYTNSGVSEVRYQKFTAGSGWGGDTQAFTTAATPSFLFSAADPTSSRIMIANYTSGNDTRGAVWRADDATDGWTVCASGGCPDTAGEGIGGPQAGIAFERFSGDALHVFNNAANGTAQGNSYMTYTQPSTWSAASTTGITPTDDQQFTKVIPSPSSNDIMIVAGDVDCDVDGVMWDGSALSTVGSNFELVLSSSNGSCANSIPIVGMMTTGGIDFAWNIYSPWGLNWRWTGDTSTANPGSWLANENVTPTGVADATTVRLRYNFMNRGTTAQVLSAEGRKKLQYTSDDPETLTATWTDVDADNGAGIWRYNNCAAGTDDGAIPSSVLTSSTAVGDFIEGTAAITMTHAAGPTAAIENDYCIEANGVATSTTYYFRAYDDEQQTPVWREQDNDGANDCATAACTYPNLTTAAPPSFTVSGGCFTTETEGTPCGDAGAEAIKVAVNGVIDSGTDATVDGAWSFDLSATPASGAILVFFIDGEATESEEATTVVKYDGSGTTIDGIKMYQSQLVIGTDSGSSNTDQTIATSDLESTAGNGYENGDDAEEDVLYSVANSDLTVDDDVNKTEQLYIMHGETYRPASGGGGDTTTHHLEIDTTAVITADSNAFNVAGDFTNGGTFTANTSTVTFNGAAAQTFTTNTGAYNAITLNNTGSAGAGDDVTISGALDVNGTLTITDGDLQLATNDPNVTTAGDVNLNASTALVTKADNGTATWIFDGTGTSTWTDSATTTQDLGLVTIDGTTKTVNMGSSVRATKLTVTDTFGLASSGYTLTLTGAGQAGAKPLTVTGTFNEGTNSTVDYIGNGATDITLETYWNLSVRPAGTATHYGPSVSTVNVSGNLVVGDSSNVGTFNLSTNSSSIDVNGNVTINASAVLIANGSGDIWIGGSYANSGTFTSNSGNVTFDATSSGKTVSGSLTGTSSFGKIIFFGTNGGWTVQNSMDVTDSFDLSDGTLVHGANTTLAVTGATFTLSTGVTWTKTSGTGKLLLDNVTELIFVDSTSPLQNLGAVQIGASPGTTTLNSDMSADSVTIPTADTLKTKGYEVTTTGAFDCQGTCALDMTSTGGEGDGTILDIGGDFTMSSSATLTASTNSKVFMNSTSGTDTNRVFTTGGKAYFDVELKNAGGTNDDITIAVSPLDINGGLTLTDGQVRLDTNDPNVTLNGSLSINANATVTKADNGTATWTFDGTATPVTWTDGTGSGGQDIGLVTVDGTTKTVNLGSSAKATKLTIGADDVFGLGSSGYTFTLTGSGTTTSRPFQNSGSLTEGTNSTFKFTGIAATDIYNETFFNLTLAPSAAGSPTYTLDASNVGLTTVSGSLVIGDSTNAVTVDNNSSDSGVDVNADVTINSGGTYIIGVNGTYTIGSSLTNSGTLTDNSGTLTFDATTGSKTITGNFTGTSALGGIIFSGSGGGWTMASDMTLGGFTLTAGNVTQGANTAVTVSGAWAMSVSTTFTKASGTGTILFNGTTAQNYTDSTATPQNLGDVTITKTNGTPAINKITLVSSMTVDTMTISASNTLDLANAGYTLDVANLGATATPLVVTGTLTPNSSSTVKFSATNSGGNITVPIQTYASLDCSPAATETCDIATSLTVTGTLTVGSNGTLAIASAQTLTHSGATLTLTGIISGAGRYTYQSATAFPATGTISSILRMDATNAASQSITCSGGGRTLGGAVEFYSNAGTAKVITLCGTVSHILNITGAVTVEAAGAGALTVEGNTYDPAVNITGNYTGGTAAGGTETASMGAGTWTMSGDVTFTNTTVSNTASGTIVMNGTGGKTLIGNNQSFNNLRLTPAGTNTINVATSQVNIGGVFEVGANTTVSSSVTINFNTATCSVTLPASGTIQGTGAIWYDCSSNTFPTTGTFNLANIWFISYYGDMTIPARTYGGTGLFRILNNAGVSRTVYLGAGTINISAPFNIYTQSGSTLIVDGSNGGSNNPTVNLTGNLDVTASGVETRTLITGTGTWTMAGNVNFTNLTTLTATTNNTMVMTGATKTLTTAAQSLYNFTQSGGSTTMSGTTTIANDLTVSAGTLTAPSSGALNVGGDYVNDATFVHNSSTLTLNGTTSTTLDTGCVTVTSCTNEDLYSLVINKTAGVGANDEVTLTSTGLRVANTLTVTAGELVQGALNVQVDTSGSVSVAASGIWTNISTGDLYLGGGFSNAGAVTFSSSNAAQCTDVADDIVIDSTVDNTLRTWSGAGTYTMRNINVDDMSDGAITITIYTSTKSGDTDWTAGSCGLDVSGTIYQTGNEGSVFDCNATNLALRVSVNGAAATTGTCSAAGGTFTVSGVTDPGAANIPVTIYTDDTANPSQKATTVTLSSAGATNITGLTLIVDRLVVSQENATALTNTHLDTANNNGDAGIRYGVSAGALTVNSGMELHVLSGKTFTPGGAVTTTATGTAAGAAGDVHIAGTLTMGTNALNVGGDYLNVGAFNKTNPQTTLFNATGSGFTLTPGTGDMNAVTFSGDGGGNGAWTLVTGNLTVDGALTINTGDSLTIDTSRTLTNSSSTEVSLGGTLTGAGTLVFPNGAGGPGTSGTLSVLTQYVATNGDVASSTIDPRTYGARVELLSTSTSNRTITAPSGTMTFSGASSHLYIQANGAGDLTFDAGANNPTMTVGGDLLLNGSGGGNEVLAMGDGTWTVTGNVNVSQGLTAPHVAALNPTWDNYGYQQDEYNNDGLGSCDFIGTTNSCGTASAGTMNGGVTDITGGGATCPDIGSNYDTFNRAYLKYDLSSISNTYTVMTLQQQVYVSSAGEALSIARAGSDTPNSAACNALYAVGVGTAYNGFSGWATGTRTVSLPTAEVQSALGTSAYALVVYGATTTASTIASSDSALNKPVLRIGYYTPSTTPTLIMNGSGVTLTANGTQPASFYNLTLSGTVTVNSASTVYVSHNFNLSGTVTNNTAALVMTGAASGATLSGAGNTIGNMTISGGTVTLDSSLTIASALAVSSGATFTIASSQTLTHTASALSNSGTINGTGLLTMTSTSSGPGATGTLSVPVRFDATGGNIANTTIDARTYGGAVEFYSNSGSARTATFPSSGTFVFSGAVSSTSSGGSTLAVDIDDTSDPTVTVTGAVTIGTSTTLQAPSGTTLTLNGNYTNNGTFTDNSGTVTLAGASLQTLSGTMTGSSDFNNLTVTNSSSSGDPDSDASTPSVTFATAASTAGTFTASTANTKLRFASGLTYTFVNVTINGGAVGTRVYLRSSTGGSQWNLTSTGTQTISNTNVRDSYACGGDTVDASDGTSFDGTKNDCWLINSISLTISDTSIGFGACTPGAARYATGDTNGAAADSVDAHTLSVATNARSGYGLTVAGTTLTASVGTISAIGGSALGSSIGTEQFGLRAIKNSGTGAVSSPFETANWAFTAGATQQVASYAGSSSSYSAAYGLRYICNVADLTEAGSYSTDLTYVLTSTF